MREKNLLLIVFVLTLLIRMFLIDTSYFFWDEASYLLNAKWFALGSSQYNEVDYRPPLVSFVLSFFYKLGNFELVSRIVMVFLNSLSVIPIYFLGKEINPKVGILAAIILVLLPFHVQSSEWIMTDSLNMLFLMLFTLFLLRKKAFLSGIFAGLAFLTKYTSLIFIPIIFVFILYHSKKKMKLFLSFLIGTMIILPHLIFNYLYFDSAFGFIFKAIKGVSVKEPVTPVFTLWLVYDLIGIVLLPVFLYSIYKSFKFKRYYFFLLYWFLTFFIVYLWIINQGTDKPPSILWMDERFLLPLLPSMLILISDSIFKIFKDYKFLVLLLLVFIIFNIPNYHRAYRPAIEFENGLRNVTKLMGIFIKDNLNMDASIYCTFNCPPIAWYGERKTLVFKFWKEDSWQKLERGIYLIKYSNKAPDLQKCFENEFDIIKKIEDDKWSVYLLQKS